MGYLQLGVPRASLSAVLHGLQGQILPLRIILILLNFTVDFHRRFQIIGP